MGSMSGKSSTNRIRSISAMKVYQKSNDITQLWPCHHPSNTIYKLMDLPFAYK